MTLGMYIVYVLAIIGIVSVCLFFTYRIARLRERSNMLKDLIKENYETEKIDLEKYLK